METKNSSEQKNGVKLKKAHLVGIVLCVLLIAEGTVLAVRAVDAKKADASALTEDPVPVTSLSPNEAAEETVRVTVEGRVASPGTYEVPVGTVKWDVIGSAGGFLKDADVKESEMNEIVTAGCRIKVGAQKYFEVRRDGTPDPFTKDGKLNINLAQEYDLENLPGIGKKTAEAIVGYREEKGIILEMDEIRQIEGITKSIYNKLLDYVTMDY